MSLTLSPAIKVFALIGMLAALALGAGMMMLGRQQEEAALEPLVLPKKQGGLLEAPAKAKEVAAKASEAAKRPAAAAVQAKPKAVVKAAKPKVLAPVAKNGMPTLVMAALARYPVVVVSLFGGDAKVDPLARDEAEAGARAARVGFVALDVTRDQKAAEALTLKLGSVLRSPAVLVFTRPDVLSIQLDGYRDRETVAQAAQNALR